MTARQQCWAQAILIYRLHWFLFFFFSHRLISEVARSLVTKFWHMCDGWPELIKLGQKFGFWRPDSKNWRPRNIKLCPISDKGDGTLRKALWLRVGEEKGWRRHWFRTTSRLGGEYLPNELNKIGPIVERKTALPGEISSARAYLILWTLVHK